MEEAAIAETAHPQQAEALGSPKATDVTQLELRAVTSISKLSWSLEEGNHFHARGDAQRRKEGLQHTLHQTWFVWPQLAQPMKNTPPRVFTR